MQITHLNSYFFSNRLHEALARKLVEVVGKQQHVFLPVPQGELTPEPLVEGVSFTVCRCFSKLDRLIWPLKMWKIWGRFKEDRKKYPADLNHAHTLFVNGLIAYWSKKKWGTPYIVTIRNTDVNQFLKKHPALFRRLGLKIMQKAEAVVTLSPVYWERNLREYYSETDLAPIEVKHSTIANGCEDFWFENLAMRNRLGDCLRLVFVGLLAKNKNLRTVLAACRLLQQRGLAFNLKVVGSGPLEAQYREEAKDMPVQFLGYISHRKRLLEIYRESDLLVVPSFTESFGVVYAEAMTQGLPIIYTAGQGFDGFFPNGTVGFAVSPDDSCQIADCIVAIKNNYSQFANNVAEHSASFMWLNAVDKLAKIYSRN